jgi:hypothetical protein
VGSLFLDTGQFTEHVSAADIGADSLMTELAAMPAVSGSNSLVLGAAGDYGESVSHAHAVVQLVDDVEALTNARRRREVMTREQVPPYASTVTVPTFVSINGASH